MTMKLIASGTVRVRELSTGREWDERVEVFERDISETGGEPATPEDAARRVARQKAGGQVETLACNIS